MGRRGADPRDAAAFAPDALPRLREAVLELGWLRGRGYAETAALQLVGDRHQLTSRQRRAVSRSAASEASIRDRMGRRDDALDGRAVAVDGFNVLITVERALGGGAVPIGADGAARDLAGVHGTWRRVAQTARAIEAIGARLATADPVRWLLDRPVSNSGRLAARLRAHEPRWQVEVVERPDPRLASSDAIVATSDAWILDRCAAWTNLAVAAIGAAAPEAWVVDLRQQGGG